MFLQPGNLDSLDQLEGLPVDPFGPATPTEQIIVVILAGLWFVAFAFWLWMLIECARSEGDRSSWLWAFLLVGFIGFRTGGMLPFIVAALYFFMRWLPGRQIKLPAPLRRLASGRKLVQLQTAAKQIGNAHQYIQLGDALKDIGQTAEADVAFADALQKEPDNIQALWGSGQTQATLAQHAVAVDRFRRVLEIDPQYKFGDVSLALGKSLVEQNENAAACEHMQDHVKRWRHPEAMLLLATLENDGGNVQAAKDLLEALILDVNGSPTGIQRRHAVYRSKAKRLLAKL